MFSQYLRDAGSSARKTNLQSLLSLRSERRASDALRRKSFLAGWKCFHWGPWRLPGKLWSSCDGGKILISGEKATSADSFPQCHGCLLLCCCIVGHRRPSAITKNHLNLSQQVILLFLQWIFKGRCPSFNSSESLKVSWCMIAAVVDLNCWWDFEFMVEGVLGMWAIASLMTSERDSSF